VFISVEIWWRVLIRVVVGVAEDPVGWRHDVGDIVAWFGCIFFGFTRPRNASIKELVRARTIEGSKTGERVCTFTNMNVDSSPNNVILRTIEQGVCDETTRIYCLAITNSQRFTVPFVEFANANGLSL